ncbi:uncharacterized protein LOC107615477 [Arachis ipaensis]|uniref:uncharacterized protein LOC107615477 n=1 Tax=Arachis ipaensis TaxID=130454 RepID=UPI0007AF9109|nr:uncharacterized protein LOC107615477 [Arachis ipaensis]
MQLKHRLSSIKIGNLVNEYVSALKGTIDALASVEEPMRESDHVNAILNGLTEEYSSVITSVVARPVSISVGKLETLLLTHESMLERFQKPESFIQENVVQSSPGYSQSFNSRSGFKGGFRGGHRSKGGGRQMRCDRNFYSNGQSGVNNSRFRTRAYNNPSFGGAEGARMFNNERQQQYNGSRMFNDDRPICQVCDKSGYTVKTCWYRYDPPVSSRT